jgi:rubrerythrin
MEKASYSEAIGRAIEIEEKIVKFYTDAAEQSKSLMADIPRAFKMVAKKRGNRLSTLKSLPGKKD